MLYRNKMRFVFLEFSRKFEKGIDHRDLSVKPSGPRWIAPGTPCCS